ncbi:MAG: DUF2163 domain-containing protein [Burkholderiaceae bacterium]|nr:DUF2163 domain-containing protein [Burkholderiaceae bacterium]
MKSASAELITLLSTQREFWMCDLYSFTLVDGTLLRYTSADIDVTVGGNTFLHTGPVIKRSRTRVALGTSVDSLDLDISADVATLLSGLPWLQAISNGALDGAEVDLERAFAATPEAAMAGNIAGTVSLFSGRVSDTTTDSLNARVMVRSFIELLNTPLPRNLYQPPCGFNVYGTGCGVSRAAFAAYSAVASGSTKQSLNCGLGNPAGYFDIGDIVMTSGQNLGVVRTVKSYVPGVVTLAYPLPKPVTVGDTFTIWPGCDGREVTCDTRFSNKPRFRGMPYVPVPETAL